MTSQENSPILFGLEDRIVTRLVEQFRSASKSIDIAVYLIGPRSVANESVKAHRRGVAVRVVTDAKVAGARQTGKSTLLRRVADANARIFNLQERRDHAAAPPLCRRHTDPIPVALGQFGPGLEKRDENLSRNRVCFRVPDRVMPMQG